MNKKYALVTGGSRGIGRATSLELAEMGYHILINYKSNKEAALEAKQLVEDKKVDAEILQFDVGSFEETSNTLLTWMQDNPNGLIEVIVNNAGMRFDKLMVFTSPLEWTKVVDVNLNSIYNVCYHLLKPMILNKYGRIVNVASLSSMGGVTGQSHYSASKAGVVGATKSLAQELGKKNITVNAVVPGFIKTEMIGELNEKERSKRVALKRFGLPSEVANLIGFLASPKASYITGESIVIDGGVGG